ncbi:MAG: hypothetical protein OEW75_09265 [Cyclobacteriaceae bacterium]|nr:hypothetical protein [Cyclobacteriaceae bacterium]
MFPFLMIIQALCLYHAYSKNVEQKWYWLIIFLPFLGSVFYLYHHFYSRQSLTKVSEGIKEVVNTNYKTEKLEQTVKFSATIQNKTNLADKYIEIGRYHEAIDLYESCLDGFNKNDSATMIKLVKSNYLIEDYGRAIYYGDLVKSNKDFLKSEIKICYALSLFKTNQSDLAEKIFEEMDSQFSNYPQRMEYAKFLHKTGKKSEALSKLEELREEYDHMEPYEKRLNKGLDKTINNLHTQLRNDK